MKVPIEQETPRLQKRICSVCIKEFMPTDIFQTTHKACQKRVATGQANNPGKLDKPYEDFKKTRIVPDLASTPAPRSPLKQAVFDLETFALDRGWGVMMVGCVLVHGEGQPKWYEYSLPQYPTWPAERSNDRLLAADLFAVLEDCHVWYAHNGLKFDVPWLNSVALKFGLPIVERKLIDPVQIARKKFRIGSNSLSAIASFLELPEEKMPLPASVWKSALLDNDAECWELLRQRCHSDVSLLNEVSCAVAPFVGMVDFQGSFRR
jgi:hypothetical protein